MIHKPFSLSSLNMKVIRYGIALSFSNRECIEELEPAVVDFKKHLQIFLRHIVYVKPIAKVLYLFCLSATQPSNVI